MNDWQRLDELLERGLDFYGRQLVWEAIQCWREVLLLSPGHRLALEYLDAAGATADGDGDPGNLADAPSSSAPPPRPRATSSAEERDQEPAVVEPQAHTLESLSALAVELIRERRLEEALGLLYAAHGEAPRDQSISRSINVVKQRLLREYRAEVGDLGQVPLLLLDEVVLESLPCSEDEREVIRLIDGIVALEDLVQSSGFGALQLYRVIAQLRRRNIIALKASPIETVAAAHEPPPPVPFRPTLVPPPAPSPSPSPAPPSGPKLVSLPPIPAAPAPALAPAAAATRSDPAPAVAPENPIGESAPRRPTAYAAHVAEAVRAHLQGKQARARELLAICVQECPDDPAARRNLERLKQRLGFDKEDR